MELHDRSFSELTPQELHDIVRLRIDVFVVEQGCAYPELDGRDPEPTTRHVWSAGADGPLCYLRLVREPDGSTTIGRIVARPEHRGEGRSAPLIEHALATSPGPHHMKAQSRLRGWYERFGFEVVGDEFVEDGIPHVPMRRDGAGGAG